jgi:hypothetical protein
MAKSRLDTTFFRRILTDPDREIMLCAGSGDLTTGFREILYVYQYLWSIGYRPDMDVNVLMLDLDMPKPKKRA